MPTIHLNQSPFEYHEGGAGEALVLVHGSAGDYRTWLAQGDAFARSFRVLAYSRRWHWPNPPIPDGTDYSMDRHLEDLLALIGDREAAPAHLVGHSYGAYLCLLAALRRPTRVRSLVLAEPPVLPLLVSQPPRPLEMLRLLLTRPRTAAAILRFGMRGVVPATRAFRAGDDETGMRRFGDAVFGPGAFDRLDEAKRDRVRDNLPNVRAELLGSGFLPLDDDDLRRLEVPTLLVTGGASLELFHRLVDRLEELLPRTERVEIPGGSHAMHEDEPEAFNTAVLDFLSRQRGGGAAAP